VVYRLCVCTNKDGSTEKRIYFTSQQNDSSDEEVIAFWLSVSCLDEHQVPMFVVEKWAKHASNVNHWMALLERNTALPETIDAAAGFRHSGSSIQSSDSRCPKLALRGLFLRVASVRL
jgi:hypothetical protein